MNDDVRDMAAADALGCTDSAVPSVLFFDVDGTLVWSDPAERDVDGDEDFLDIKPAPGVPEAFARLRERGQLTFLCTGRPLPLVSQALLDLGFTGIVSGAGACVSMGDEIVFETLIDPDVVREMAQLVLDLGGTVMFESREQSVVVSPDDSNPAIAWFPSIPVAHSVEEMERLAPRMRFGKVATMGGIEWITDAFTSFIDGRFTDCFMGFSHEFSPIGVNKGTGVRHVLEHLGRGVEGTFAFGDSENDLPMFDAVETKVAMANGLESVKARADYVTGHVAHGGIEQALRHFGLI